MAPDNGEAIIANSAIPGSNAVSENMLISASGIDNVPAQKPINTDIDIREVKVSLSENSCFIFFADYNACGCWQMCESAEVL